MAQLLQITLIIVLFVLEMVILRKVFIAHNKQALSVLIEARDSIKAFPENDDSVQVPPYIGQQPTFFASSEKNNDENNDEAKK